MYNISARNVNEAFCRGLHLFKNGSFVNKVSPRGKETLEYIGPVCTVYHNPTEKVLLYKDRDANPFFHFFESLWILAGTRDVAFLEQFNSKIREYSDDGKVFHGAYGYRLRHHFGINQIEYVVDLLKREPDTRRAVLQIWDSKVDLNSGLDLPCNDIIFLKIREGRLNMTVCCRSNDVIWGAYGANVVQFGTLIEYLAAKIGCEVGKYTQISDSFHIYSELPLWKELEKDDRMFPFTDPYTLGIVSPFPMVTVPEEFDTDLVMFMENMDTSRIYKNKFFNMVARPMWYLWKRHKEEKDGLKYINLIQATDWKMGVKMWLERREVSE